MRSMLALAAATAGCLGSRPTARSTDGGGGADVTGTGGNGAGGGPAGVDGGDGPTDRAALGGHDGGTGDVPPDANALPDAGPTDVPVVVGPAAKLAFSVQPSLRPTFAGTPFGFTVEVEDSRGLRVTSSIAPITVALGANPGGSNLLGVLTSSAVAGVAVFDTVGLDQVATGYTLIASSPQLTPGTSAAFDVRQQAFTRVTTGLYGGSVSSIAIGVGTPAAIYAGTPAGVFKSINGGGTWSPANFGNSGEADLVVVDPKDQTKAYITSSMSGASSGYGGFTFAGKTTNGGSAWRAIGQSTGAAEIGSFVIDPMNTSILYAGGPSGLFKSTTGGDAWTKTSFPFACYSLTIDPITMTTLYAYAYDQTNQVAKGVYKSVDSGANWAPVNNAAITTADLYLSQVVATPTAVYAITPSTKAFRSVNGGATWTVMTDSPWTIAYAPSQVMRVYLGRGSYVQVSNDGGATFSATPVSIGGLLQASSPYALVVDPADPNHVFAATDSGVFVSTDGAATWRSSSIGISTPSVSAVVTSPTAPGTLIVSSDATYRTLDAGTTWTRVTTAGMQTMTIDPANAQSVYGCSLGGIFYRSANGGASWDAGVDTGGGPYCYTIAMHGQSLWVPTVGGSVRRSIDGGVTWMATSLTAPSYAITVDPTGTSLYASTNLGTYKSIDSGAHWTVMLATDLASAMLVDPLTATTIHAGMSCGSATGGASGVGGFKRSINSGASWTGPSPGPCVNRLIGLASGTLLAVGRGTPFVFSLDHGATWTSGGAGILGEPSSVAASSDGKTIYVGTALGLYKSTTGGL